MKIYLTFFLVIATLYKSDAQCNGNANAFIDEVLANARPDLAKHMPISDINDGNVHVSGITVWGFDSLKRAGNFCLQALGEGKERVVAELEVFNIHGAASHASYKATVKVGFVHVSHTFNGHAEVDIPHIKIRLGIDIDLNARHATLYDFAFEAFDNPKVHVHINGILSILNHIADLILNHMAKEMKPKAEAMIHTQFATHVNSFNKFDLIPH